MNSPIIRKWTLIGTSILLGMLAPISAQAKCSQSDLQGTWLMYTRVIATAEGSIGLRCKLKLNSSGDIVASKSSCVALVLGEVEESITPSGGFVTTKSNCRITGEVQFPELQPLEINHGTLAKDKNTFSANGNFEVDGLGLDLHLTAVKR